MTVLLILYAVGLTIVLSLAIPRLPTLPPRLRRLFAITAGAGVAAFAGVLWWALAA